MSLTQWCLFTVCLLYLYSCAQGTARTSRPAKIEVKRKSNAMIKKLLAERMIRFRKALYRIQNKGKMLNTDETLDNAIMGPGGGAVGRVFSAGDEPLVERKLKFLEERRTNEKGRLIAASYGQNWQEKNLRSSVPKIVGAVRYKGMGVPVKKKVLSEQKHDKVSDAGKSKYIKLKDKSKQAAGRPKREAGVSTSAVTGAHNDDKGPTAAAVGSVLSANAAVGPDHQPEKPITPQDVAHPAAVSGIVANPISPKVPESRRRRDTGGTSSSAATGSSADNPSAGASAAGKEKGLSASAAVGPEHEPEKPKNPEDLNRPAAVSGIAETPVQPTPPKTRRKRDTGGVASSAATGSDSSDSSGPAAAAVVGDKGTGLSASAGVGADHEPEKPKSPEEVEQPASVSGIAANPATPKSPLSMRRRRDSGFAAGAAVSEDSQDSANPEVGSAAEGKGGSSASGAASQGGEASGAADITNGAASGTAVAGGGSSAINAAFGTGASAGQVKDSMTSSSATGTSSDDAAVSGVASGSGSSYGSANQSDKLKYSSSAALVKGKFKKSGSGSASGKGSQTSSSVSSPSGTAVSNAVQGAGFASGTADEGSAGTGLATGVVSNGGRKGGSAAAGSALGGSAATSLTASDNDSDYDDHSSSIAALSARSMGRDQSNTRLLQQDKENLVDSADYDSDMFSQGKPVQRNPQAVKEGKVTCSEGNGAPCEQQGEEALLRMKRKTTKAKQGARRLLKSFKKMAKSNKRVNSKKGKRRF